MTLKESLNLDGTRGSKYNTVRHHARKAVIGIKRACTSCGYNLHVDVCHIKAIKDFNDSALISEINALSNLTFLCKNHHWELDNGYPIKYRSLA